MKPLVFHVSGYAVKILYLTINKYSITSMAQTLMARLLFTVDDSNFFQSLQNSSYSSRKQIFNNFFLFYHGIVSCVYSLELPH